MNLSIYEIDQQIQELVMNSVDEETGEVLIDPEAFEALQLARDQKVENIGVFVKDLMGQIALLDGEAEVIADRKKKAVKKVEGLKKLLDYALAGEKFQTAKVDISFRKSTAVEPISKEEEQRFIEYAKTAAPELLKFKEPTPDKTAIGKLLKAGETVNGFSLVERNNISVK